ncbi:methyltransferase family protein [Chryseobacterium sp. M5A1_1a]
MKTLDMILYTGIIIWFLIENYNLINRKSETGDQKVLDKIGLARLWVVYFITLAGPVLVSKLVEIPISNFIEIRYLGLFVFVFGVGLRLLAIQNLGKFFTMDLSIKKDHQLITNGVYKYIRHPAYSACIIAFIGIGLALNNWLSLFIAVIPGFLALNRRIESEEKALMDTFGNEYTQYRKKTKKWLPFIY